MSLIWDSWLAWQINDAVFLWGDFVDGLIRENGMRDKRGRPLYRHNIKHILGYGEEDSDNRVPSLEEMEIRAYTPPADAGGQEVLEGITRNDGSIMVDSDHEIKNRRYQNPLELLKYAQPGRKSEVVREHIKLPQAQTSSPPSKRGNVREKLEQKRQKATPWDEVEQPRQLPPDWTVDGKVPDMPQELPEDWTIKDRKPRRPARHFTITEDGEIIDKNNG